MISSPGLNNLGLVLRWMLKAELWGTTFGSVVSSVSSVAATAWIATRESLKCCSPSGPSSKLSTPKSDKTECLTLISHSECLQNSAFVWSFFFLAGQKCVRVRTAASSSSQMLALLWRELSHFSTLGSTFKCLVYFVLNHIWVACSKFRSFCASSSLPEMPEVRRRREMPLEMKLVFQCIEVVLEAAQTDSTGDKCVTDSWGHILEKTSGIGRMHSNLLHEQLLRLCLTEDLDCWFSGSFHLSPTVKELLALHWLIKNCWRYMLHHLFFVVPHCVSQIQCSE